MKKKVVTKEQVLYSSTYIKWLEKSKFIETESRGYQRQGVGGWGVVIIIGKDCLFVVMKNFGTRKW